MRPLDRRLLGAVPGTRRLVAGLAGLGLASGVVTLALTVSLAALVTAVASGGTTHTVLPYVVLPALLLAARGALAASGEVAAAGAGARVSGALRRRLVEVELAPVRAPGGTREAPYDVETIVVQGCSTIEVYVARYLPSLVTATVLPVLAVATLVVVDPWSALVVVLTLPLLPLFAALIGRATHDSTQRRWRALSALAGHFGDVMRGLPTLVSYGRGEAQAESVRAVSERHRRATIATLRIAFLSSTALEVLATIAVALVAVFAGVRLAGGDLDLRTALVAILLAPEAYWPIRRVGAEFHAAADGAEALDTVLSRLSHPTPPSAPTSACCGLCSESALPDAEFAAQPARSGRRGVLRGVVVTYPSSDRPVLDGLDLTLDLGLTVVVGPSGAGKTTLLEVLAGLRPVDVGRVDVPPAHLVTQRPFLVPGSVADNLCLGGPQPTLVLVDALAAVGLDGLGDEHRAVDDAGGEAPDGRGADVLAAAEQVGGESSGGRGVDGLAATEQVGGEPGGRGGADVLAVAVGDDGIGLSAGQRTRLALARALLAPEPVLLLDEPTAHVDDSAADDIIGVLRRLSRHRVVVAVTHDPRLVAAADHLVELAPVPGLAEVAS